MLPLQQSPRRLPLPAEPKIDNLGRSYATGRRKDAAARVWVKRGTGQMKINGRDVTEYFARPVLQMILAQPFETTERVGEFDVFASVKGGGLSGQAGAVRHGISRALTLFELGLRPVLKSWRFPDARLARRRAEEIWQGESPPRASSSQSARYQKRLTSYFAPKAVLFGEAFESTYMVKFPASVTVLHRWIFVAGTNIQLMLKNVLTWRTTIPGDTEQKSEAKLATY